jgi:hypothetical protein
VPTDAEGEEEINAEIKEAVKVVATEEIVGPEDLAVSEAVDLAETRIRPKPGRRVHLHPKAVVLPEIAVLANLGRLAPRALRKNNSLREKDFRFRSLFIPISFSTKRRRLPRPPRSNPRRRKVRPEKFPALKVSEPTQ